MNKYTHRHNVFVVEGTNMLYSQPSPAKPDVNSLTGQYKSGVSQQQYCLNHSKNWDVIVYNGQIGQKSIDWHIPCSHNNSFDVK